MTSPHPTTIKPIQLQITQAIKYLKTQFPPEYVKWKNQFQGQKIFETHLNVIEYMFSVQAYAKLREKIWDELLIKLRFFSINQSYLINFEAFLLEKLIKFITKDMKMIFNFKESFNVKDVIKKKQKFSQMSQRYSILFQSLINVLKFCFNQNSSSTSHKNSETGFNSDYNLKRVQETKKVQIVSREFVTFVVGILEQNIQDVIFYQIMNVRRIYPLLFSTFTDGFLRFSNVGGSKFVEITGKVIAMLVRYNRKNIWVKSDSEKQKNQITSQLQKLELLNKQVMNVLNKKDNNNFLQNTTKQKQPITQKSFSSICKQRLLLFLQQLLTKFGYNYDYETEEYSQNLYNVQSKQQQMSKNRRVKMRIIVNRLLDCVVESCFYIDMEENEIMTPILRLQDVDNRILFSLVLLSMQLSVEIPQETTDKNTPTSQLFTLLSNHTLYQTTPQIVSYIYNQLHVLFMFKFKLLMNKNKTISTQKTLLLKQLKVLVKYVTFSRVQTEDFRNLICMRLKQLFKPNEQDMNRPLIIALDDKNRLQGTMIGQAIPLTPLQSYHSVFSYPITLTALKQSLKFQQTRHILDEIRLFQWFQHQQTNLTLFRQLLCQFEFNSKLNMLEYFLQELMRIKVMDGDNFYGLEMSLTKFYQVLILEFYIDCLLSQQAAMLKYENYKTNKELYDKSITEKLKMIYELIVSNIDMKKLLISNKEQQLLIFFSLRIMYNINNFFYSIEKQSAINKNKCSNRISLLYSKMIIAENLILYMSHQTYLLQLLLTSCFLEFSAPNTIQQTLKSLQSTLIHRNAGCTLSNKKQCNLEFIKNLIKVSKLKSKQAEKLAEIYLSKNFITNQQANSIISLLFPYFTPQTMRKCLLSVKNWPIIFLSKSNIQLLNNQPLVQQSKESLFYANDNDNVTVSNALGVIMLQLNQKWIVQLQFKNPKKQILIDAMINLIQVNDQLIFWKRFFFENIMPKLVMILKQIDTFIDEKVKEKQQQKSRRILLYQRIHNKIYQLLTMIPVQYYKYSCQITEKIKENLMELKQIVQKLYTYLKKQCFVHQRYQYLDKYKQANSLLEKIDTGLKYKQDNQQQQIIGQEK